MSMIDELVKEYLAKRTNYAILITGEWGIGKTYHFENVLKRQIEKTTTIEDNSKYYTPIRVSLFGLKSIEDIQSTILLTLYPILKNKSLKIGSSIAKACIKGALYLKGISGDIGIDNIFNDVKDAAVNSLDYSSLVICFDDLERKSEQLKIEELIGYINTLVDDEKIKVIIIANEDKLAENYSSIKEKVIGNTIVYNVDFLSALENIINANYSSDKVYSDYLLENKDALLGYFNTCRNLRIVGYALEKFQTIFSQCEIDFAKNEALSNLKSEVLLVALRFICAISIEYKEHRVSYVDKRDLNKKYANSDVVVQVSRDTNQYVNQFISSYYSESERYVFWTSVYDYITGGKTFSIDNFIEEIKRYYKISGDTILDHNMVLNNLIKNWNSMSDLDYRNEVSKMLGYAYQSKYDLVSYGTIIPHAFMLDFGVEEVTNKLISSIDNVSCSHEDSLHMHMHFGGYLSLPLIETMYP